MLITSIKDGKNVRYYFSTFIKGLPSLKQLKLKLFHSPFSPRKNVPENHFNKLAKVIILI